MAPSFVEWETDSSIADVVQVECESAYAGDTVKVRAPGLCSGYGGGVTWTAPYPYSPTSGEATTAKLTGAGDATLALWGGPSCPAGSYVIEAELEQPPHETVSTSFEVQPPRQLTEGVSIVPGTETVDKVHGSAAMIIEMSASSYPLEPVRFQTPQTYAACSGTPHLAWIGPEGNELSASGDAVSGVPLDLDGNTFALILAGTSCSEGSYIAAANLEEAPFTTWENTFSIKAARRCRRPPPRRSNPPPRARPTTGRARENQLLLCRGLGRPGPGIVLRLQRLLGHVGHARYELRGAAHVYRDRREQRRAHRERPRSATRWSRTPLGCCSPTRRRLRSGRSKGRPDQLARGERGVRDLRGNDRLLDRPDRREAPLERAEDRSARILRRRASAAGPRAAGARAPRSARSPSRPHRGRGSERSRQVERASSTPRPI